MQKNEVQGLQVLYERQMQQLQPIGLVHAREMEGGLVGRSFSFSGLRWEGLQGFRTKMITEQL